MTRPTQGRSPEEMPLASGVGRFADEDNPEQAAKFLLVGFRRRLTDDELRSFHDYVREWNPIRVENDRPSGRSADSRWELSIRYSKSIVAEWRDWQRQNPKYDGEKADPKLRELIAAAILEALSTGSPVVGGLNEEFHGGAIEEAFAAPPHLASEPGGAWQPIESAPKDGARVLLYAPGHLVMLGAWTGHGMYNGPRWWSLLSDTPLLSEPTLWMPLPEPSLPGNSASAPERERGGGSVRRRLDEKSASDMTDWELAIELRKIGERWDKFRAEMEDVHAGSPGEWMYERMNEIETEIERRGRYEP